MHRAMTTGAPVAGPYPEWRSPEIIPSDDHVVDRKISYGELHSVAIISATNRVLRVKHIIDRRADRMGNQSVVTIGSDSLIDIVVNDLPGVGIEDVDAIEPEVASAGGHPRVAVCDAKVFAPNHGNGVGEWVTSVDAVHDHIMRLSHIDEVGSQSTISMRIRIQNVAALVGRKISNRYV